MTGFLSLIAMIMGLREVVVRFTNVTRDLVATQAAADQANQAKTEFLARMSHDLRTPLNAVIGFADVIRSEVLGGYESWPRYRDYAGDIVQSGEFLLAMVNDLLDISRIEAGGLILEPEPVAIDTLVGQVVTRLRQQAARDGVTLLDESTGEAGTLVADRRALEQILQNLLSNAVKFTPTGNSVGVRLSRGEETLTITVWDNGIGIAAEELPHLGEPFRRIGRAEVAEQPGTGLGIAIVKNLVSLHGGTLTFESEVGSGTTAHVTLPLAQGPGGQD
jgi:cell cycle sensor histidine kinase DivJ